MLYSIVGIFINFSLEHRSIKKEIKRLLIHKLPDEELSLIMISKANSGELRWMKKDKEFRYKGNMYDVVRSEQKGDTTYYRCFNDTRETRLFAHLDKLVKDQTGTSRINNIQKVSFQNYIFTSLKIKKYQQEKKLKYFDKIIPYKSIELDTLTPPPKSSKA